jgi:hypothetical protein
MFKHIEENKLILLNIKPCFIEDSGLTAKVLSASVQIPLVKRGFEQRRLTVMMVARSPITGRMGNSILMLPFPAFNISPWIYRNHLWLF